jgi:hypothetical protein
MFKRSYSNLLSETDPTFIKAMRKTDIFLWAMPFLIIGPMVAAWLLR